MDKANSRRQCCRQIWIFFITRTHTLICWGWQRQKHSYFLFHSGLLLSFLLFFFHVNKVIWSLCLAFRQNVSWFLFSFHFYRLYWDYLKWKIDLIYKKINVMIYIRKIMTIFVQLISFTFSEFGCYEWINMTVAKFCGFSSLWLTPVFPFSHLLALSPSLTYSLNIILNTAARKVKIVLALAKYQREIRLER